MVRSIAWYILSSTIVLSSEVGDKIREIVGEVSLALVFIFIIINSVTSILIDSLIGSLFNGIRSGRWIGICCRSSA